MSGSGIHFAAAPEWQWGTVVDKRDLAPGTSSLTIALIEPFEFVPGQYVNVHVKIEGRSTPMQRAYSIASAPTPGKPADTVEIVVSRLDGGLVSPLLVAGYEPGTEIEVRGPYGRFVMDEESEPPFYFVAAGSGIVPFLSMIRAVEASGTSTPVTMLLSNRDRRYAIAGDEIDALAASRDWFRLVHTFTRDEAPVGGYGRRIDEDMLRETGALNAGSIYVCGPPAMVETTVDALEELGVEVEIFTEAYP